MESRYGVGLWAFGTGADRYNPSGYHGSLTTQEKIEMASQVENLRGVELKYPTDFEGFGVELVKEILDAHGLQLSAINVNLSGDARWQRGSVTNTNEELRQQAVERSQKAVDAADAIGADSIVLWLGQDGHDYLFNDYQKAWQLLLNGLVEVASHNRKVIVYLEYKHKEPRTHLMISNVGKAILAAKATALANVGVIVDVGHGFMVDENVAESIALVHMNKTPLYMHFNDCYGYWDDDMVPGAVNIWKFLELFYQLKRIDYQGWHDLDIYPFREDPVEAVEQGVRFMDYMRRLVNKNYQEIEGLVEIADVHQKMEGMRRILLKEY